MNHQHHSTNALNAQGVKQAAAGRELEILRNVGGIDGALLDGKHHRCPKACSPNEGGKDRFRLIDVTTGSVFCNQCFN